MKFTKRFIATLLSLSLILCSFVTLATGEGAASGEIPYVPHDDTIAGSAYDSVYTVYSADEAAAAGVPEGYTGEVIKVTGTGTANSAYGGLCIDYSAERIPIDNVESITMRIYLPSGNTEMRMRNERATSGWVMRQAPASFNAWADITLTADGGGFYSGGMSSLANAEGNLSTFCLIGRFSGPSPYYYLDSITVKYKAGVSGDEVAPVITYNGPTELSATEGDVFELKDASAFDEFDAAAVPLSYSWSVGATTASGALNAGTHTCTVSATDRSGNTASITVTVTVKADKSRLTLDTIPYLPGGVKMHDGNTYAGTVTEYTAASAPSGTPSGFTGKITKVESSSNRFGLMLDPSEYAIPVDMVDHITFRFYFLESGSNTLRMGAPEKLDEWLLLDKAATGWYEYTVYADGRGFTSAEKPDLGLLANADGTLGPLGIMCKYPTSETADVFYIDSVIITLKSNDMTPPVLNYSGESSIITSADKPFAPDISAFDAAEEREIPLVYEWSEGAIDERGHLIEGEHTVTVSATDYYGNRAEITLSVTVGPKDTEPPVIDLIVEDVYATAGTLYRFALVATDNFDNVTVLTEWSEGAIDIYGALAAGEHTLTLTVTDLTGNTAVKVVRFHVGNTTENEFIIDQGA